MQQRVSTDGHDAISDHACSTPSSICETATGMSASAVTTALVSKLTGSLQGHLLSTAAVAVQGMAPVAIQVELCAAWLKNCRLLHVSLQSACHAMQ